MGTYGCSQELEIEMNLEQPTEYLLIQRLFNDYYFISGPLFIIIGLYLCLFAQNRKATKFTVSIVLCQICTFILAIGFIGIGIKWLEFVFVFIGIMFGSCLGYFCLGGYRLFRVVESVTAGFIFGLYIFDITFSYSNYHLAQVILTDTILIFIGFFVVLNQLVPEYHIFLESIMGGYIFTRGLSILLFNFVRYRELQLMLFLINRYEMEYIEEYKKKWKYYWIYDIFIFILIGASIFNYIMRVLGREEDEVEKKRQKDEREKSLIESFNSLNSSNEQLK